MTHGQPSGEPAAVPAGPADEPAGAVLWLGLAALAVAVAAVVLVLSVVIGLAAPSTAPVWVVGSAAADPDPAGYPPLDEPSVEQSTVPTPFPAGGPVDPTVEPDGTQAAPLATGKPGTVGAWHVTIDHAVDGTAALVADGAATPVHGRYVLLQVTGMFEGDGHGDPAQDLVAGVRDGAGADWFATDCGAVPDEPLGAAGPVLGGQWFTAGVCVDLPPTGDQGAVLFLQTAHGDPDAGTGSRTYFR